MTAVPISNGRNGRGQFVAGHAGGPGNPNIRRLGELQRAVREACTPGKLAEVLDSLHAAALKGDTAAAKVWLDRALGPAMQALTVSIDSEATASTAMTRKAETAEEIRAQSKRMCQGMIAAADLIEKENLIKGVSGPSDGSRARLGIEYARVQLARIEAEEAAEAAATDSTEASDGC